MSKITNPGTILKLLDLFEEMEKIAGKENVYLSIHHVDMKILGSRWSVEDQVTEQGRKFQIAHRNNDPFDHLAIFE